MLNYNHKTHALSHLNMPVARFKYTTNVLCDYYNLVSAFCANGLYKS